MKLPVFKMLGGAMTARWPKGSLDPASYRCLSPEGVLQRDCVRRCQACLAVEFSLLTTSFYPVFLTSADPRGASIGV